MTNVVLQRWRSILEGFLLPLVSSTTIHLLNDSRPAANWNINPPPFAQTNTEARGAVLVARVCTCVHVCPLHGLEHLKQITDPYTRPQNVANCLILKLTVHSVHVLSRSWTSVSQLDGLKETGTNGMVRLPEGQRTQQDN